jgi:hypothetical protein
LICSPYKPIDGEPYLAVESNSMKVVIFGIGVEKRVRGREERKYKQETQNRKGTRR